MTHVRLSHLALGLALAVAVPAGSTLRAEEPHATAPGKTPDHAAPEAHGHETTAPHAPAQGDAHAAPATHGEAHGEAAHGGGHHGPEIKLFGKVLGPGAQFLVKLFNFIVFAGGLFFMLKGVLSAAFKARTQEVEERLTQAEKDKAAGEAQIRELEARMAGLQGELDELLSRAQADAEAEKARILEGARQEAAQVVAQARQDIAAQQRLAEQELKALVADLAVKAAEDRLRTRLQDDTARRILDRAITQVGGAQ